jgi:hypothetical protein
MTPRCGPPEAPRPARVFWRAVEKLLAASADPALRAWTRAKYDALRADATVLNGNTTPISPTSRRGAPMCRPARRRERQRVQRDDAGRGGVRADSNVVTLSATRPSR